MPCEQFKEDLQAYFDGELAPPRRAALEAHLHNCEECNQVAADLQTVSNVLAHWIDRAPSEKFELMLHLKLADERLPGEQDAAEALASPAPGVARKARRRRVRVGWFWTGWRPAATATAVLMFFVVVVILQTRSGPRRPIRPRSVSDMVRAFADAGPGAPVADASIYAASASKKAIESEELDPARVACADVVYAFLVSTQSQGDKNAGWRLINLLSSRDRLYRPIRQATARSAFAQFAGLFVRDLFAGDDSEDPLAEARRYEFAGRLREALRSYREITDTQDAARARLAEGALRLRMGDLDDAVASLDAVEADSGALLSGAVPALLAQIKTARRARGELVSLRQSAKTAADWHRVGLFEVRAYDFRSAANSFMKAANAAGEKNKHLHDEARFRSAWCQKEIGQISTAIYGFRSIAGVSGSPGELEYCAAIEEAVALARVERFEESVAVCRALLKVEAPTAALKALACFHKGSIELRYLEDVNAACESLRNVASDGQGNLSYAAQCLLQANGR